MIIVFDEFRGYRSSKYEEYMRQEVNAALNLLKKERWWTLSSNFERKE